MFSKLNTSIVKNKKLNIKNLYSVFYFYLSFTKAVETAKPRKTNVLNSVWNTRIITHGSSKKTARNNKKPLCKHEAHLKYKFSSVPTRKNRKKKSWNANFCVFSQKLLLVITNCVFTGALCEIKTFVVCQLVWFWNVSLFEVHISIKGISLKAFIKFQLKSVFYDVKLFCQGEYISHF